MLSKTDPIAEVLQDAKRQCQEALSIEATNAELLSRTSNGTGNRHVVRVSLQGGRDVVLKQVLHPNPDAAFKDGVAAYAGATKRMGTGRFTSPALLWSDEKTQTSIYAHHSGLSLDGHLTLIGGTEGQMVPYLTTAGQWLAEFHDVADAPQVAYQPRFMIEHLTRQMAQIRSGRREVADSDMFQIAAGKLAEMAPEPGVLTRRAPAHGDLNARNILIDTELGLTCGLDFVAPREAPIGHDIARLLVDVAIRFGKPAKVRPGAVVPPAILKAFFAGYGPEYENDPSVQFLQRYALLAEWLSLPAKSKGRSWRQDYRLDQVRKLVRKAFPT